MLFCVGRPLYIYTSLTRGAAALFFPYNRFTNLLQRSCGGKELFITPPTTARRARVLHLGTRPAGGKRGLKLPLFHNKESNQAAAKLSSYPYLDLFLDTVLSRRATVMSLPRFLSPTDMYEWLSPSWVWKEYMWIRVYVSFLKGVLRRSSTSGSST